MRWAELLTLHLVTAKHKQASSDAEKVEFGGPESTFMILESGSVGAANPLASC